MGGAYTAIGGDLESVFWNPAGIASLEGTATGFTQKALYADMSVEDVAVATPFMDGVIGISGLAFLSVTLGPCIAPWGHVHTSRAVPCPTPQVHRVD